MGTENIDVTHSASNVSKKRKHKHKKHNKSNEKEQKNSQQKNIEDDGLDPLWTPPFHQRSPPPVPNNKQFVLGQPLVSSALLLLNRGWVNRANVSTNGNVLEFLLHKFI